MLSGICAFCGNHTHFTARSARVKGSRINPHSGYVYRFEVAATCDACHRFNTAYGVTADVSRTLEDGQILVGAAAVTEGESMKIVSWSPPAMLPVDTTFIPSGVAGFLKEAHDAFSISAYRAVLLLVRSVVEATAKDRGILKGELVGKINKLFEAGEIRKGTKDMAHALRILGNDMAHGDIDAVPTREDADDALKIARFVLDDVYVADAIRADMLERRGEAKSSVQPSADATPAA
ncbi:DUF4145 domain-containing protein [Microbacterium sp. 22215]|uniref:DUF4145 domain-containing protein n=1 Tax=Microbacterium sp. 22215 TaxID=3453893 RepID=UPI003F869B94